MKKVTYFCDVCGCERSVVKKDIQVLAQSLEMRIVEICDGCLNTLLAGNYLYEISPFNYKFKCLK